MESPFRLFLARSRGVLLALLAALFLLIIGNQIVFGVGIYSRVFSNESAAGQVMLMVRAEKTRTSVNSNTKTAIVFGDSRLAEGFSSKQATAMAAPFGLQIVNAAIPSTTPRCWYYFLKKLDPDSNKYDFIVLGLPSLVKPGSDNLQERILDLDYLAPILSKGDYWDVSSSFASLDSRINVLRMLWMKGFIYKYDFQDLLMHPKTRSQNILHPYVSEGWSHNYDYNGRAESLSGVIWDDIKKTATFPKDYSLEQKKFIETYIQSLDKVSDHSNLEYNVFWLSRLLQKYQGSKTRLIVFQVPAGPLPTTAPGDVILPEIANLQTVYPQLTLLPAAQFRELESPDLFFDYLHLNSAGRQRLTKELTDLILLENKQLERN